MRSSGKALRTTLFLVLIPVAAWGQGKGKPGPPPPPPPPANPAITFVNGTSWLGDIMVINADGTNIRSIGGNGISEYAKWSPDGRYVIYNSRVNGWGEYGMFIVEVATGNTCRVPVDGTSPVWSPVPLGDGKYKIAYVATASYPDGKFSRDVFLIDADPSCGPSNPVNLTQSDSRGEALPTWSPDGASLAVIVSDAESSLCNNKLAVYDGIAVASDGTAGYSMFWKLAGTAGSAPNLCVNSLQWSKASSFHLALGATWDDGTNESGGDLWVADIGNRAAPSFANITNTSTTYEFEPSWSPDDSKIVYQHVEPTNGGRYARSIYVINADGSGRQPLAQPDRKHYYTAPDWRRNP